MKSFDNTSQNQQKTLPQSSIILGHNTTHVPKLKFTIGGTQCELPSTLSQRRNSALQSLFQTTTSLGSVLNSARGNDYDFTQTLTLDDETNKVINLESTAELKAFATVDLDKINMERTNQLKLALEDNLREKENELKSIENSYYQQKNDYDVVNKKHLELSQQLESEVLKQKQKLANLKEELKEQTANLKEERISYDKTQSQIKTRIEDISTEKAQITEEIKKKESETQILELQRKSLRQNLDMQKRLKSQEYDMKINPLIQELEQVDLHTTLISENLASLRKMLEQNMNESQMIQEDLATSESQKVDLVFEREDLENYLENLSSQLPELQNLLLKSHFNGQLDMASLLSEIVSNKQRRLLIDLIRELQQYILGMSAGTTDTSMMQSDELEDIDYNINHLRITHEDAVYAIVEFASRKLDLSLDKDALMGKLAQVKDGIDAEQIAETLNTMNIVEEQMRSIDQKIKVISNRCQNELRPRVKALLISESQVNEQLAKLQDTEANLLRYRQELSDEIDKIQLNFQQSFGNNDEEMQSLQQNLENLNEQFQSLEYDVDNLKRTLENFCDQLDELRFQQEQNSNVHDASVNEFTSKIENLKSLIKQETQKQSEGHQSQLIEQLSIKVAQSKCDKESSNKRLKYLETKLQNAQDSVMHARQVLDNHVLQAQQEKLNLKVHLPSQKRISMQHAHSGSLVYGQTQSSRISSIQQKAPTLHHGEILSPSKEESRLDLKRYQSVQKEKADKDADSERMHSHFIDPSQSEAKHEPKRTYTSDQKKRVQDCQSEANLKKEKSTIDVVRYYYESSSAMSSEESQIGTQYQQFVQRKGANQQRMLPIQNFITPRDPLHEMQNTHNFIYESCYNQMSAVSNNDSLDSSAQKTDRSLHTENASFMQSNSNHLLSRGQRLPLKQHNSSYDGKSLKNVVIPLYAQFKENVTPNLTNASFNQASSNGLNIRKLSQATNISHISNQSILQTIQSGNRPPAVPQSKNSSVKEKSQETPRGSSSQKEKKQSMHHNSRKASRESFTNLMTQKPIQTKLRLQLNVNNLGRALQVGIVDLPRCGKKDEQFYESVKPLLEGAQFLVGRDSQHILNQFYLDFSLLRLYMVNFNGDKEVIMIENVVKPELPQNTLDQIRQEKADQNSSGGKKRYEFSVVISVNNNLERLHLQAMTYEELKLWIVGLNALISNKNSLMRLSCQIQSNI